MPNTPILPAHIKQASQATAKLHHEHAQRATSLDRLVDSMTRVIGRPMFVGVLTGVVAVWIAGNLGGAWLGFRPWDRSPFSWLQGAVGLAALYVAALILTTQRREDQLASDREQLTLELTTLSLERSEKITRQLEEMHREVSRLRTRVDHIADAMCLPDEDGSLRGGAPRMGPQAGAAWRRDA